MRDPQKQILDFLQRLTYRVVLIDSKIEMYEYLVSCAQDRWVETLNRTPAFFKFVMDAFLTDVIINLSKLYDRRLSAKRSLLHYLRLVDDNIGSLEVKEGHLTHEIIAAQRAKIESARPMVDKLTIHRDKVHAHDDKTYFDEPFKVHLEAPLDETHLRELVEIVKELLLEHHVALRDTHFIMRAINADEARHVVTRLQQREFLVNHPVVFDLISDGTVPLFENLRLPEPRQG